MELFGTLPTIYYYRSHKHPTRPCRSNHGCPCLTLLLSRALAESVLVVQRRFTATTVGDHICPHKDSMDIFLGLTNWQPRIFLSCLVDCIQELGGEGIQSLQPAKPLPRSSCLRVAAGVEWGGICKEINQTQATGLLYTYIMTGELLLTSLLLSFYDT